METSAIRDMLRKHTTKRKVISACDLQVFGADVGANRGVARGSLAEFLTREIQQRVIESVVRNEIKSERWIRTRAQLDNPPVVAAAD